MTDSRRGNALIFVLWAVVCLSLTALSLGERTRIGLSLVQAHAGEVKAKALAWAGMIHAIDLIREGSLSGPKKLRANLAEGEFEIVYEEEESKINLNALGPREAAVLSQLALLSGMDQGQAQVLSQKVMKHLLEGGKFYSIEDLSLVAAMAIPEKLRDALTVFPRSTAGLKINLNTAPEPVLKALIRGVIGAEEQAQDVDGLSNKIITFRAGEDGRDGTTDDRTIDFSVMSLNKDEERTVEKLSRYRSTSLEYLRLISRGSVGKSIVILDAVVYRPALAIVEWRKLE